MTDNIEDKPPSAWIPTTNVVELAVLGKLGEEAGELVQACTRCIIQGVSESEPETGVPNRRQLIKEMADVASKIRLAIEELGITNEELDYLEQRAEKKYVYHKEWINMLRSQPDADQGPEDT